MAKKAGSKTELISNYVAENPEHTWKQAEATLGKHGITSNYFSTQRSMLRSGSSESKGTKGGGKKKAAMKMSSPKASSAPSDNRIAAAAEFARNVGGLDKARKLIDMLSDYQV